MALDDMSGLVFPIGGDLSPLTDALNDVPDVVKQAAASIDAALGDSLSGATAGVNTLNEAMAGLGTESAAGSKVAADSVEHLGAASGEATPHIENLGHAEHEASDASEHLAEALEEIGKKLLGLFALEHIVEVMKEFVTESIEAAADTERWETGMKALTGSAEQTEEILHKIKEMATTMAVPFESLLTTTQKLTAKGMDFEQITRVMQTAQDAAVAAHLSFEGVASALEKVFTQGQLGTRQILQLGITWEQMAESMNVSVEEAQSALKKGTNTAEVDLALVENALRRFGGTGAEAAKDVKGSWQILQNQMELIRDEIGKSMEPATKAVIALANQFQPVFVDAVKEGARQLTEFVIALTNLLSIGAPLLKWLKDVSDGWLTLGNYIRGTLAITTMGVSEILPWLNRLVSGTKDVHAATSEWTAEMGKAYMEAEGLGITLLPKFNIGLKEHHQKILDIHAGYQDMSDDLDRAHHWFTEVGDVMKAMPFDLVSNGIRSISDAAQVLLSQGMNEELDRAHGYLGTIKNDLQAMPFNLLKDGLSQIKAAVDDAKTFEQALRDLGVVSGQTGDRTTRALLDIGKLLSSGKIDATQLAEAWDVMGTRFDEADAAAHRQLQTLKEMGVPMAQLLTFSDNLTKSEMQHAVAMGNVGAAIRGQLQLMSNEWGNTAKNAVAATAAIGNALVSDIGNGLTALITQTGSVGDAFAKLGMDVLQIVEQVIIKELIHLIMELTIVKTLMSAVFGFFGFSGGGVVPASSAGGWAAGGFAEGGIAGAAGGWQVPGGGFGDVVPAMLTPGEIVLPVEISKGLQNAIKGGTLTGADGGGGINITNLYVSVPDASNPRETAREIATYLKGLSRKFATVT